MGVRKLSTLLVVGAGALLMQKPPQMGPEMALVQGNSAADIAPEDLETLVKKGPLFAYGGACRGSGFNSAALDQKCQGRLDMIAAFKAKYPDAVGTCLEQPAHNQAAQPALHAADAICTKPNSYVWECNEMASGGWRGQHHLEALNAMKAMIGTHGGNAGHYCQLSGAGDACEVGPSMTSCEDVTKTFQGGSGKEECEEAGCEWLSGGAIKKALRDCSRDATCWATDADYKEYKTTYKTR